MPKGFPVSPYFVISLHILNCKLLNLYFSFYPARLRDHDVTADKVISSAQSVLKEVEAMRQYQEDIDSLNSIAHNRPRAQLVLGRLKVLTILIK